MCVFVVAATPRLQMRKLLELGVGVGVIYSFMYIFQEIFQFFHFRIVFLLGFRGLLFVCGWFLIFDNLVASLYIGRICMVEHLSII